MGDTYNIAVIGAGNIGARYIEKSLLLQREFVKEGNKPQIGNIFFSRQSSEGVQDARSRLEKIVKDFSAEERGRIHGFTDYVEMLKDAKTLPESKSLVVIASPYKYHYSHIIDSLRINPDVILCEKPVCRLEDIHALGKRAKGINKDVRHGKNTTPIYVNQQIALADWFLEQNNSTYKMLKDTCETASITWICPNKVNYEGGFSQKDLCLNLISHPRSVYIGTKLKQINELEINEQEQTIFVTASVGPVLDSSNRTLKELHMTVGYGAKQCKIEFRKDEVNHIFEFNAGTNPEKKEFSQKFDYSQINQAGIILLEEEVWLPEDLLKMTLRKIITGETDGLVDLNAARLTMSDIALVMDKTGYYRSAEYKAVLKKKERRAHRSRQNAQGKEPELSELVNA